MKRYFPPLLAFSLILFTCTHVTAGTPVGPTREIACAPTNYKSVAALIGQTIWISTDEGKTWNRVDLPGSELLAGVQFEEINSGTGDLETGEEVYDVGSDEEILDDESRRIEWDPGPSEFTSEIPKSDTQTGSSASAGIYLAISDDGLFAACLSQRLFLGDANGLTREIYMPGINGFVFDQLGRLWITQKDTIFVLGNPRKQLREVKRWRIQGARAPVFRSRKRDEVLVPAFEGVWVAGAQEMESIGIELVRFGEVSAVADAPDEDAIYMASRGRVLLYCGDDSCRGELPSSPGGLDRLETDGRNRVIIRTESSEWFVLESGGWRSIRATALDVDANKRIWVGTEFGPSMLDTEGSLSNSFVPLNFLAIQSQAEGKISISPGPPPTCRRFPINPLPKTQFFFGLDQDMAIHFDTGLVPHYVPYSGHRRTGLYFGLQFTWSLDPVDLSTCYHQQRNWQRMRTERVAAVQTLLLDRQRMLNTEPKDDSILLAADLVIRKKRNDELIQIVTEVQDREER